MTLALAACTGTASTPAPPGFPLVPCPLDGPGAPTARPGYTLVAPGTIAFGWEALQNVNGENTACGTQAVRAAKSVIAFSSLEGEDRIPWVAVLARPGQPTSPDPVPATMTLSRLDPGGPVVVETQTGSGPQYMMLGNFGHDAEPGSYFMRIVSGTGNLLAAGGFEIVN